jgi:alanyl-tRNA synthetase
MTARLYYTDSYTTAFSAAIIETLTHEGRPAVVLDRTYFYPIGGGQPHDTGRLALIAPDAEAVTEADVLEVVTRPDDKAVVHVLSQPLPLGAVAGEINGARRRDFMQQHTGQHILSQAFVQCCQAHTIGFHLGETVTIDLDKADVDPTALQTVEALANQIIYDNLPVRAYQVDPDSAEALGVRMRGVPDMLTTSGLRVVEIERFDRTACGGTHVRASGEVGMIKVLRTEKYKGGTRVEFVCGRRALTAFEQRVDIINALTAALTCALPDLPAQASKLQEDARLKDKRIKNLAEQLIDYQARDLLAQAELHGGARVIISIVTDGDAGTLRLMAARLTREPGVIALLGLAGDKTHIVCARSADLPQDMHAWAQQALAALGGRGGGQPALAQGGAGAADVDTVRAALMAALAQG